MEKSLCNYGKQFVGSWNKEALASLLNQPCRMLGLLELALCTQSKFEPLPEPQAPLTAVICLLQTPNLLSQTHGDGIFLHCRGTVRCGKGNASRGSLALRHVPAAWNVLDQDHLMAIWLSGDSQLSRFGRLKPTVRKHQEPPEV